MHEKSPYMMFVLIGSLVMMMTVSIVFHMPKNGARGSIMSNILALNTSKNIGGEIEKTLPKTNQNFYRYLGD